jgi:hypothetical protein
MHRKGHGEGQDPTVAKALNARRESKAVEFKSEFDPALRGAWCEILKDIVAIANSGGGVIVIGLQGAGFPNGADVQGVLGLDPAEVTDKIHAYTGVHFADIEIIDATKDGYQLAMLVVRASESPIVFTKAGTYDLGGGKQKTAFSKGTVYFRHGAKSEPGTTADIAGALERRLAMIRREWLSGVRRVVQAPPGSHLSILPREIRESDSPDAVPIRVVDDSAAPAYRIVDPDRTHPFRQKELIVEVRKRLPKGTVFNQFDVQAIRKTMPDANEARFHHKPRYGSPQYSGEFADWIVDQYEREPQFFQQVRERFLVSSNR